MESTAQPYEVRLGIFEGPLDLLVYLVQKSELNPREIQISTITDQFLEYLDKIGVQNLSQAGDFLVMASRLMLLKARELLPQEDRDPLEELEFQLDREALIKQMMLHQTFKHAANFMRHLENNGFGTFSRGAWEKTPGKNSPEEITENVMGVYELLSAFSSALKNRKNETAHHVEIDDVTIENQIKKVQHFLRENPHCLFEEIFTEDPRIIVVVVCFMALLELTKLDETHVQQYQNIGPIWVYRKKDNPDFNAPPVKEMEFSELGTFPEGLVELLQEEIKNRKDEINLETLLAELDLEDETIQAEENESVPEQNASVNENPEIHSVEETNSEEVRDG